MLVLFDIDGTLLLTQGAGIAAMRDAGRELFGPHFTIEGVEFSGRLDALIWNDLAELNEVANADQHHDRFRAAYSRHLQHRLQSNPTAKLLPGVKSLVQQLSNADGMTVGLLTGNYPETGQMKIRAAGLDPDLFAINAWGCEGQSRRDLPLLAMDRYATTNGGPLPSGQVIIIGDTPHDIDCAKVHGCRSIGVATGAFNVDSLRSAGADLAVDDLSKTREIMAWILHTPQ